MKLATAEDADFAREVHAEQYRPDAGVDRLAILIGKAEEKLETARARVLLLRALNEDPQWRLALLACGVSIVEAQSQGTRAPDLWDGIDLDAALSVLRRAIDRVKVETGVILDHPERLLAVFAMREWPLAPSLL